MKAKEHWKKYNSDVVTTLSYKEKFILDVPAFL